MGWWNWPWVSVSDAYCTYILVISLSKQTLSEKSAERRKFFGCGMRQRSSQSFFPIIHVAAFDNWTPIAGGNGTDQVGLARFTAFGEVPGKTKQKCQISKEALKNYFGVCTMFLFYDIISTYVYIHTFSGCPKSELVRFRTTGSRLVFWTQKMSEIRTKLDRFIIFLLKTFIA